MVDWIGTANRECHTVPVLRFRESLQQLGLLRKYRGRLLLTRAGAAARGNPERLWRHLAERLPLGVQDAIEIPTRRATHPGHGRIEPRQTDLLPEHRVGTQCLGLASVRAPAHQC